MSSPLEPSEPLSEGGDSSEPSDMARRPADVNRKQRSTRHGDRSELYRRMKLVDPNLARKYRQLEGE